MWTRRHFLKTLGTSLAAVPILEAAPAHASGTYPTRVLFVTQGQGTLIDKLVIPGASPSDWTLGPILAPLQPFADRLSAFTGIDDATNLLDGNYNGHTRCLLHTWVCRAMHWQAGTNGASPVSAGGISLDQLIASRWSGSTPYDSLEFGVRASSQTVLHHFWRGIGQPMPPENSPANMYERLFADLEGTDPGEVIARQQRRERVLAAVKAQFDTLTPRVSGEDRTKLQIHLQSLDDLTQSLQTGAVGDACRPPEIDLTGSSNTDIATQQAQMIAMAFACDLTRVASLTLGDFQDWSWYGLDFPSGWHDAVHAGPVTLDLDASLTSSYTWYTTQLATLLAALDAIPEGDGTVLDHTLVIAGNIFSSGAGHSHLGKTYLLAGGGAGLIGGLHHDLQGTTNGDLFTTVLNALGFADDAFGDPAFVAGPHSGVFS